MGRAEDAIRRREREVSSEAHRREATRAALLAAKKRQLTEDVEPLVPQALGCLEAAGWPGGTLHRLGWRELAGWRAGGIRMGVKEVDHTYVSPFWLLSNGKWFAPGWSDGRAVRFSALLRKGTVPMPEGVVPDLNRLIAGHFD